MRRYDYDAVTHLFFDTDDRNEYHELYQTFCDLFQIIKKYLPIDEQKDLSIVNPTKTGPVYFSDPNTIFLSVHGHFPAQLVFQAAHELCHYSIKTGIKNDQLKWFEETLCDTSSLFFLDKMSQLDGVKYSKGFFADYLSDRLLPNEFESFEVTSNPSIERYDRAKHRYLSVQLFSIFKQHPCLWNEVPRLAEIAADDFESLMNNWTSDFPDKLSLVSKELKSIFNM